MVSRFVSGVVVCSLVLIAACGKNPPMADQVSISNNIQSDEQAVQEAVGREEPKQVVEETGQAEASVPSDETTEHGTLKLRFVYQGNPPTLEQLTIKDSYCGEFGLKDQRLLVNAENKGIQNVAVYLYTGRGGINLPEAKGDRESAVVDLVNKKCQFDPRIVLAQAGDTLRVDNPDDVGHNANFNFFNNDPQNTLIPAKQHRMVELLLHEPAPIPVDCNLHPWMKSHLLVLNHPFAGVSNEDGEVLIEGLPTGDELIFRVFHEAGAIKQVNLAGADQEWKRSRFETLVQAGENDLGTIIVPTGTFD